MLDLRVEQVEIVFDFRAEGGHSSTNRSAWQRP
jgi:hypothetical protein